jgi:uncharacterized protein
MLSTQNWLEIIIVIKCYNRGMANYHEVFRGDHAVLPVVHVQDAPHAIRNTGIAQESGADGVFLISMEGDSHYQLEFVQRLVKKEFPGFWIGVNYLDLINSPIYVFANLNPDISGVWLDDAMINPKTESQIDASGINSIRKASKWDGLYFGGVAFKYRNKIDEKDLAGIAQAATHFMDVVTTSGDGTGQAPEVSKIQVMKEGVGYHPLAIASGITPENVHKYLDLSDAYLVSSSLLIPGTENFDPAKVKALVEAVKVK